MGVILAYFDDMESYYYQIPDLFGLSCRRLCNLALHWLRVFVGDEQFHKEYRELFYGDPSKHLSRQESLRNIKPAIKGVEGSLNIEKKDSVKVTDISMFLGRSTGGQAVSDDAPIDAPKKHLSIMPDSEGNITVSGGDDDG